MALTQETILTFLQEQGGKVKNSELLNKFKEALSCSDPVDKKQNRDLFKSFVNNIAVVKVIDEVKFVVVKKKYQGFGKNGSLIAPKNEFEDTLSRFNSSASSCSPERTDVLKHGTDKTVQSAIENNNNNSYFTSNINAVGQGCKPEDNLRHNSVSGGCCNLDCERQQMSPRNDSSVQKDVKPRKTGAVFAIIAVKSPTSSSNEEQLHTKGLIQEPVSQHLQAIRITPPQRRLEKTETTSPNTGTGEKPNEDSSPETKRRQLVSKLPDTPQLKKNNKTTKPNNEPKYSEGVPLELAEHDWLVKSAAGHWDQVYGLLLQDVQLADKRDFISGFAALHWAAKDGNKDMVRKIIDTSRDRGVEVDINARSHAGYTPLHIAAIHGHDIIISLLVRDYWANVNVRDNSGKKPYHYLDQGVSKEVREILGDPHITSLHQEVPCEQVEEDHSLPELPKGFNTLSKLFHPHSGHRKKHRHRPSFHFHIGSEDPRDDRREHVLSRRLSEMFH
ncbi:ankyrin repeat domain-containing protein SOWAHB [Sardina pilchardus]|uniref:ankyrin repeat domain-containing protein SOWAHB n=1 Tax=Sardina pilchardus TaxID=27697 RepID=UPI002E10E08C